MKRKLSPSIFASLLAATAASAQIPGGAFTTAKLETNRVGFFTSLTIGADGLGLISYHDFTNSDLKVAHCSNIACTAATTATLDSHITGRAGPWSSIAIGTDGRALISYYGGQSNLKTAHRAPRGDFNRDGRADLVWRH